MHPAVRQVVLGGRVYAAEARALFAAMSTPPSSARKDAYQALIVALKSAAVWDELDLLYILAAHDEQAGRLNLKAPGAFTLTAANSPTFTADRGFAGDGATAYLDTGWDPATNGVKWTANACHLGVYARTTATSSTAYDFGSGTSTGNRLRVRSPAGNGATGVNSTTVVADTGTAPTPPAHKMGIRRDASNALFFNEGVQNNTGAAVASGLSSVDFNILRVNNQFSDRQMAAAHVGSGLDDTKALALYNALHTFMVAVGADT